MAAVFASELEGLPVFEPGAKVRARRAVRNDGTYPGRERGDYLLEEGEIGYVKAVGTYLNRYYIYSIDFIALGMLIGMRANELEELEPPP